MKSFFEMMATTKIDWTRPIREIAREELAKRIEADAASERWYREKRRQMDEKKKDDAQRLLAEVTAGRPAAHSQRASVQAPKPAITARAEELLEHVIAYFDEESKGLSDEHRSVLVAMVESALGYEHAPGVVDDRIPGDPRVVALLGEAETEAPVVPPARREE